MQLIIDKWNGILYYNALKGTIVSRMQKKYMQVLTLNFPSIKSLAQ